MKNRSSRIAFFLGICLFIAGFVAALTKGGNAAVFFILWFIMACLGVLFTAAQINKLRKGEASVSGQLRSGVYPINFDPTIKGIISRGEHPFRFWVSAIFLTPILAGIAIFGLLGMYISIFGF